MDQRQSRHLENALKIQTSKHNVSYSGTRAVAMWFPGNWAKGQPFYSSLCACSPSLHWNEAGGSSSLRPTEPNDKVKQLSFCSSCLCTKLLRYQVFQVDIQACQREDRTPYSTYVQQRQESGGLEHTSLEYSWNVSVNECCWVCLPS